MVRVSEKRFLTIFYKTTLFSILYLGGFIHNFTKKFLVKTDTHTTQPDYIFNK